jgi:hypothetical protein
MNLNQPVRIVERQRPHYHASEGSGDGYRRADPERKGGNSCNEQAGRSQKRTTEERHQQIS